MSSIRIGPFLLMPFIVLWGCAPSPDQNAAKENQKVEDSNPIDGHYIEYYPNGSIKVKGQKINGKKDGLWKYYSSQNRMSTPIKLFNQDTLVGWGAIQWHDTTQSSINLKDLVIPFPNDTASKTWGYNRQGIQNYYFASWSKTGIDTVVLFYENGDSANLSISKNGVVFYSRDIDER